MTIRRAAAVWTLALLGAGIAKPGIAKPGISTPEPACSPIRVGDSLPLPCALPLADYEEVLYRWVNERTYASLGWQHDPQVRDTGPFVLGANYGTHPAVRIYYSPGIVKWLEGGRKGEVPVGEMLVKEMFSPPAARLEEQRGSFENPQEWEALVASSISSWTIMIRDDQTHDGWFWAGVPVLSPEGKTASEYAAAIAGSVDTNYYPFEFRRSSHGAADCLRCHSSAEGESTFASLENLDGTGLVFRVDNSWRTDLAPEQRPAGGADEATLFLNTLHRNSSAATATPDGEELSSSPLAEAASQWARYFPIETPVTASEVVPFPGQWADHVTAGPDGAEQFITSDNCLGCHGGLGGAPFGVTMFLETGPAYGDGYNISPFGEWRWSPMGLAGRDPAFYSQVATELAILDEEFADQPETLAKAKNAVVNTCLSCHGGMGQRQLLIDVAEGADLDPNFQRDYVLVHTALTEAQLDQPNYEYHKYGNLAREGISCTLCHHADPPPEWKPGMSETEKEEIFLTTSTTGQFAYSPPDELNGPFDDVLTTPMESALGITPKANDFIRDSRMCGTCHAINLPNVDCPLGGDPGNPERCKPLPVLDRTAKFQAAELEEQYGVDYASFLADNFPHSIEQATYLEWKNSDFATDPEAFQSCQDCHMPRDFRSLDGSIEIETLTSQIASIQDSHYPQAENSLPASDLDVPFRPDYRRHELVGLNAFLVEMFDQFDPILGLDETDYMTSATNGDRLAVENMILQGRNDTVKVEVDVVSASGNQLVADVTVESLVGHRFPSGVGFRRTWIEFQVLDNARRGEVVWASGRTNSVGLIVDGDDEPLATEFFAGNEWQPHYHGIPSADGTPVPPPVTREDQVQIYEEVTLNGEDQVTFSFIHRDQHPKDNRLIPRGWKDSSSFESEILRQFMEATDPEGVEGDPDYLEGNTGVDRVRYEVTLPPGTDAADVTVRATMYYQAFQPFWFKRKFDLSGDDPATRRLYFLASHLRTEGTVLEGWKLRLTGAEATASATAKAATAP